MERFTPADLECAVEDLSMCQFFPAGPGAQAAIMRLLADMCPHKEALDWVVSTMVNRVGKWAGPAELRGLLCWRFRPADGIEADCSLPGFSTSDGEAVSLAEHAQFKADGYLSPGSSPRALERAAETVHKLLGDGGLLQ